MGIRRIRTDHADDATEIGKIYPQDRYSRSHPHHDAPPRPGRGDLGGRPARESNVERHKPGVDPTPQIERLYRFGRSYPHRQPHDRSHQDTPRDVARNPMAAKDQSANQFADEKIADHVDVPVSAWTRSGMHPFFDHGCSGFRHSTKVRR